MGTARALVVACAVAGECAAIGAQPAQPATQAHTVAIVATVTDRDHHLVSGLSSSDFDVRDDGLTRPHTAFNADRWPLSVTVLVDRSDSLSLGPRGVRAAAARFIADLLPKDEGRVCAFAGYVACSPRFTTDHDELAQEVRRPPSDFGTHLIDALWSALDGMDMTKTGRRHVIVVFSDGEDNGSHTLFSHLKDRLRASDVMVYGIGLQTRFDDGDDFVSSRPDLTLRPLAIETGADYDEAGNHRELENIVTRIEEELRHQYVLMFTPASNTDRTHRLQVRATQPSLRVRTRQRFTTLQR